MNIGITLEGRIKQAVQLPRFGTLEDMVATSKIRKKLVGFGEQQMINWRIVPVGDSFVCGLPTTPTSVTLEDDLVVAWAKIIRNISAQNGIDANDAELYKQICDEADRIIEEANAENQDGE